MTEPAIAYVTIDVDQGRVEVHHADHLAPRLRASRFHRDDSRGVWFQRFRNESELLPLLSWLVSQHLPFHEDVPLKPKHLDLLRPCRMIHFEDEGGKVKAVIEDIP